MYLHATMNYLTADELEVCWEVRRMCACNHLRRATRGVTQIYETGMAQSGLKVTQLPILVGLATDGDMPICTLASKLSLDRTTLTRNLQVLEERGLVCMYEQEDDARVRIVSITLGGSSALTAALAPWEKVQAHVEEAFGRERLQALSDELAALSNALGT